MPKVGTLDWAKKTDGILSRAEYVGLHKQLITLQFKEFRAWLSSKGFGRSKPLDFDLDDIIIPDSSIALQTDELVRDMSSSPLHSHCVRTYIWGYLLGKQAELKFDPEIFYIASILHDLGLVEPHVQKSSCACFAVTGAQKAEEFLLSASWDTDKISKVFEAISLHLNLDVRAVDHFPEAEMLANGAHLDVVGSHYRRLSKQTVDAVIRRFPRDGFLADIKGHIETPHHARTRATMLNRIGFSKLATGNPLNRHQVECIGHL
ncbi:HD domain-containing protein [Parasphingorhabdus litoris]|uniref:HD domain-containing protein n=1 Tax=Parasphingorhabdus litoris TaxID=394733 RepID=A0ABN1A100_9SPHN|nr:HD domain-containing protein [Parasphingorhabdus litoris]